MRIPMRTPIKIFVHIFFINRPPLRKTLTFIGSLNEIVTWIDFE